MSRRSEESLLIDLKEALPIASPDYSDPPQLVLAYYRDTDHWHLEFGTYDKETEFSMAEKSLREVLDKAMFELAGRDRRGETE